MCIDFCVLNQNMIMDHYPSPRINNTLDCLGGVAVYSKIDYTQAYHQGKVAESDRHQKAFQCQLGLYEYTVLPFGFEIVPMTL